LKYRTVSIIICDA